MIFKYVFTCILCKIFFLLCRINTCVPFLLALRLPKTNLLSMTLVVSTVNKISQKKKKTKNCSVQPIIAHTRSSWCYFNHRKRKLIETETSPRSCVRAVLGQVTAPLGCHFLHHKRVSWLTAGEPAVSAISRIPSVAIFRWNKFWDVHFS